MNIDTMPRCDEISFETRLQYIDRESEMAVLTQLDFVHVLAIVYVASAGGLFVVARIEIGRLGTLKVVERV